MQKFYNLVRGALTLSFVGVFLCGCASNAVVPEAGENAPEMLMEEGLNDFEQGYYQGATEAFQKIIDRYPYSKYYVEAELKLADALYHKRSYDEAFDAYNEFQRLHPKNINIPYVIYQKGMCHFTQVGTLDREQSHTLQAKEAFELLTDKFPQTEYADQATWKIRVCYAILAGSELYVGHFYFKMKKYKAAMNRYRYILENYPDLGQYHEALEYLIKCKEKLAEENKAS
ncbi:MAG: outer membrane protein assembly factor BamD [Deltaproteobacteria bacterium]|nr:outer membrane protein assembly factor BamD [Deltaproteobacteria bacterium]